MNNATPGGGQSHPNQNAANSTNYAPHLPKTVTLANPKRRLGCVSLAFLAIMTFYSARLIDLQLIKGPSNALAAQNSRIETRNLPALRGSFTDINGVVLASSMKSRHITADQTKIKRPEVTANLLLRYLKIPKKQLVASLTGDRQYAYVAKRVPMATWRKISDLGIAGIFSDPATTRVYPSGSLAASILGYVGDEGRGLGGLEEYLDKRLTGIDGKSTVEQVKGREIPTSEKQTVASKDGLSVRLTIDADLQGMAERALAREAKKAGAKSGNVVVMDPATGNILAMATYPTFNPNKPFKSNDLAKQNRAVTETFEPGSTSKIMTMAAVIEEGALNPKSKMIIPSGIPRGGTTFHDHDPHGTLRLTLNGVLAKSSNIGSIMASEKIGQDKFLTYLQKFGVGEPTGLNFPGESSGSLPRPGDGTWSGTTFPTLAFGQGLSVTALQVASVYATIANNGVRLEPRLVAGYTDDQGNFIENERVPGVRVVSAKTAKTVRTMLESVVSANGTAPGAQIPGYRIAGKTGTANKYTSSGGYSGYTASFVGIAPADKPELVVSVIMQNPVNGHYGAIVSAPVFKQVTEYALAHFKIPPSASKRPTLPVTW